MPYSQFDRNKLNIKPLSERKNKIYIERDHIPVTQKPKNTSEHFKRIVKEVIILYSRSFKKGYYEMIVDEASGYIDTLGRKVSVDTGKEKIKGIAYKIGKYGALYIKDDKGRRKKILASEIVHCR